MLLLAFDTTAAACSVALVKDGVVRAQIRELMDQGQAEALMPMIEQLMAEAGFAYGALERIAVTVGPGSFTGVRVGLSAARALGLAAAKPVVGVGSLEVLAEAVPEAERRRHQAILAAIDTKRGELYLQTFDPQTRVPRTPPVALPPAQIQDWLAEKDVVVVGDGTAEAMKALSGATASMADPLPDAVVLARLAAARAPEPAGPLPLYVLPPKVTLAPHGGRLRP
jgi:tRNA threonylcarbamoyladenosine biosynthesis protein TsaB